MSKYETFAGHVTRGETFAKILHLTDELLDQTAVMAHLHETEDSRVDKALANGWRAIHHVMQMMRGRLIELSKGTIQ